MNDMPGVDRYRSIAGRLKPPSLAFIGGKFRPAASGKVFENINPATGEVLGTVAHCDAADVDAAVTAAHRVFEEGTWSRAAPEARKEVLLKLANLVRAHKEELATLESLDSGKTITDCLHEIGEPQQHFLARLRRRARPGPLLEHPARRGNGGVDIGGIAMGDAAQHFARRRIDVLEYFAGGGRPKLAVDEGLARQLQAGGDGAIAVGAGHVVHGGLPA